MMNSLKNIIERCHQRHEKPLQQRQTVATHWMFSKDYPHQYIVYCAYKYPVILTDLEQLEEWSANWHGNALGNFAKALLNVIETRDQTDSSFVKRIRAIIHLFQQQEEEIIEQLSPAEKRWSVFWGVPQGKRTVYCKS